MFPVFVLSFPLLFILFWFYSLICLTFQLRRLAPRNCQQVRLQLLPLASSLAIHQWQEGWPPAVTFEMLCHLRYLCLKFFYLQLVYTVSTHTQKQQKKHRIFFVPSWNFPSFVNLSTVMGRFFRFGQRVRCLRGQGSNGGTGKDEISSGSKRLGEITDGDYKTPPGRVTEVSGWSFNHGESISWDPKDPGCGTPSKGPK